ncbi:MULTISPECIES: alpha/beta hydrolase family protein [Thalassospira]|uniref:Signal peptide protein n=2 Tax=Thalassospira TaxID=168934 RepID=A0A367W987_9PROT|nr:MULTISPECIES: alpha/beta fold hydrolase [Thalassospira]MDG4718254.1 alpha/beta fold hydrolase [Thalassospira sp. FZY0004]RCK38006.1 signal peptide protein [Thalassospira profundimaris]
MKHVTSAFCLTVGLIAAISFSMPVHAKGDLAGYDRFDVTAAHRSMPLAASIWYPAGTRIYSAPVNKGPIWKTTMAYIGAAIAPGKHPLVLLSHGSGGNMDAIGWLSSELALRGAMVVAVNHPGTTSGDSSPRRTSYIGQRSADITATLDQLLANPEFAPYIDTDQIAVAGFSLGGSTVLNLAGLRFDRDLYRQYCDRFGDTVQDCAFLRRGGVKFDQFPDDLSANSKDPRIQKFIVIEPGMTDAVDPDSIKDVDGDFLFIRLGREHGWRASDVEATGSNLLAKLDHPEYAVFAPANHLTFLGECVPGVAEMLAQMDDDPICSDPAGTDRGLIHAQIIDEISGFLSLKPKSD